MDHYGTAINIVKIFIFLSIMMKIMHASGLISKLFVLTISLLLTGVSIQSKNPPEWVQQHPVDKAYYTGVGVASKQSEDYVQIATKNALHDLASQISVKISASSSLKEISTEDEFSQQFQSMAQLKLKNSLSQYELMDSWENGNEYWVYYRLSKAKYRAEQERKLRIAKEKSYELFKKASSARESYEISNALLFYIKALQPLTPYLHKDLTMLIGTGKKDLVNVIYSECLQMLSNIGLQPNINELNVRVLTPIKKDITVHAIYDSRYPINDLPLVLRFHNGAGNYINQSVTNKEGVASLQLSHVSNKAQRQQLNITLDASEYGATVDTNMIVNQLFQETVLPSTSIMFHVSPLQAKISSEEVVFGTSSDDNTSMERRIISLLSQQYFDITNSEDVPLEIKTNIEIHKGKHNARFNLYTVNGSFHISIRDKNGTEIFSDTIEGIKGTSSNGFEEAAENARSRIIQAIRHKTIPKINTITIDAN